MDSWQRGSDGRLHRVSQDMSRSTTGEQRGDKRAKQLDTNDQATNLDQLDTMALQLIQDNRHVFDLLTRPMHSALMLDLVKQLLDESSMTVSDDKLVAITVIIQRKLDKRAGEPRP